MVVTVHSVLNVCLMCAAMLSMASFDSITAEFVSEPGTVFGVPIRIHPYHVDQPSSSSAAAAAAMMQEVVEEDGRTNRTILVTTSNGRKERAMISHVHVTQHMVGMVEIGEEPFQVIFDTGSSPLWVFGKDVNKEYFEYDIVGHSFYDKGKSATFRAQDGPFHADYADGTTVDGIIGSETIKIGDIPLRNTLFGISKAFQPPPDTMTYYDGIFGLDYVPHSDLEMRRLNPFARMVASGLLDNDVFSIYMSKDGLNGDITFGGWDERYFNTHTVNFVPVVTSGYIVGAKKANGWIVNVDELRFGDVTIAGAQEHDGIFGIFKRKQKSMRASFIDTGSTHLVLPEGLFKRTRDIRNALQMGSNDRRHGRVSCSDRHRLPKLDIIISGKTYSFSGTDYTTTVNSYLSPVDGILYCRLLLASIESALPDWDGSVGILGAPFLRKYYTMFFYGRNTPKLGFAEAVQPH